MEEGNPDIGECFCWVGDRIRIFGELEGFLMQIVPVLWVGVSLFSS